jgi:hypothetical protein
MTCGRTITVQVDQHEAKMMGSNKRHAHIDGASEGQLAE